MMRKSLTPNLVGIKLYYHFLVTVLTDMTANNLLFLDFLKKTNNRKTYKKIYETVPSLPSSLTKNT